MSINNSDRTILKNTLLFGGSQIILVLAGLLKSKIIALYIGPEGVGVSTILNNLLTLFAGLFSVGIGISGIREISKIKDDKEKAFKATQFRQLSLLLSCFCFLFFCAFSSIIGELQFGNNLHTIGVLVVGLACSFTILTGVTDACLKSYNKVKSIALNTCQNSILGVVIAFFFYYLWGLKAVPYVILFGCFINYFLSSYRSRNLGSYSIRNIHFSQVLYNSKPAFIMGGLLVLSNIIENLVINVQNVVIRSFGSLEILGIYAAAMSISTMSTNMIFSAVANDYYPRLSACGDDSEKVNEIVNSQMKIAMSLLAPVLSVLIVFSPFIVSLLLSDDFNEINSFIYWIFSGTLFYSITWCLYYVPLSKGDSKLFFLFSIIKIVLQLSIQIPGFIIGGLKGLAIAYYICVALNCLTFMLICKRGYNVSIDNINLQNIFTLFVLFSLLLLLKELDCSISWQISVLMLIILFCIYSLYNVLFTKK